MIGVIVVCRPFAYLLLDAAHIRLPVSNVIIPVTLHHDTAFSHWHCDSCAIAIDPFFASTIVV